MEVVQEAHQEKSGGSLPGRAPFSAIPALEMADILPAGLLSGMGDQGRTQVEDSKGIRVNQNVVPVIEPGGALW
jgi:hypothetical protein